MMNPRGWRLMGAIIGVAGLALAGCGDDGGSTSNSSSNHGPLAEFFGWDDESRGGEYEATEEERQQHYEVQEYAVTCMSDAGFEYFPEPFWGDDESNVARVDDPWEEMWQLQQDDPEAFAREYGYGITTVDHDDREGIEEEWDPSSDPNWEYRESLSEAAQEEYEKALWGDWSEVEGAEAEGGEPSVELTDDPEPIDMSEVGGCMNEAYDEIYGWNNNEGEDQFEELWERWDDLYEGIENDARMVDLKQAWTDCMADAGHIGLSDFWDAESQVHDRQSELYGWNEGEQEEELSDPDAGTDSDEEPEESEEPIEPDPADLADLREFELAIAWADFECRRDHDVERVRNEVTFEYEERFIEDNRAELEAYRDWQNERGY